MHQVIAFDDRGIRVREKCVGIAALGAEVARSVRRVNADGGNANAAGFKIGEVILDTP
jgi:hypothetical protein